LNDEMPKAFVGADGNPATVPFSIALTAEYCNI
jgi:hypothetical protein